MRAFYWEKNKNILQLLHIFDPPKKAYSTKEHILQ